MHVRQAIAAACFVAIGLAACSGDDDPSGASDTTDVDDTTTTSSTSSSTTTTTEPAPLSPPDTTGMYDEAQVRAVVEFSDQLVLLTADPDDPLLEQYLTGLELERVQGVLRQGEAGGFSLEGERNVDITSVEIVDGRADVRACVHTDFRTLDSSGTEVDRIDQSIMSRFLLEKTGESWKVEDTGDANSEGETEPCEAGT